MESIAEVLNMLMKIMEIKILIVPEGLLKGTEKLFKAYSSESGLCLVNSQPDALFRVFIYSFHLSTCFEHQTLIIRRWNCINTSSGMISLCK